MIEMYLQDPRLGPISNAMKRDFHDYLTAAKITTYQLVCVPTGHKLSAYAGSVGVSQPTQRETAAVVEEY
jgi:hypothetical protein